MILGTCVFISCNSNNTINKNVDEEVIKIQQPKEEIVVFEDENLEKAIRQEIGKQHGDILKNDVEVITHLYANSCEIKNISGIEKLGNLTSLSLPFNQTIDIEPLKESINLRQLYLYNNQISDIEPLKGLSNLWMLFLDGNKITNYEPLKDLHIEHGDFIFQEKTFKLDTDEEYELVYFDELYSFDSKTFTRTHYKIPYLHTVYSIYGETMVYRGTDHNMYVANMKSETTKKLFNLNEEDYFNSYTIQNDILYFETSNFFGKLNMFTKELEKIDSKTYYSAVESMIKEKFYGGVYADSQGVYFVSDITTKPQKFIGIDWNKGVMFIEDSCDPIHIKNDFIWLEKHTDDLLYTYTKDGQVIYSHKIDRDNGYYNKYVPGGLYYIDDTAISFVDSDFEKKTVFSGKNILRGLSIVQNEDKILCISDNELLAFDKKFELLYKIKMDKKETPITEDYLNIQKWFPVLNYGSENVLYGNHMFLVSNDYEKRISRLSVLNLLTKERYHIGDINMSNNEKYIDSITASWFRETFVIGDIIYYFPES